MLQSPEIPERLPASVTWNCSVSHWPLFQRHFRCNLRQECASGEDEVQCPYSPCSHGGVNLQSHCYFIVASEKGYVWTEAQQECRKAGGSLASLASVREWNDVMSLLHFDTTRHETRMAVGLASTAPDLPFM